MARSEPGAEGGLALPETARRLLDARSIVTLATLNPDVAVEIRGVAELIPDPTRSLSRELTNWYLGRTRHPTRRPRSA